MGFGNFLSALVQRGREAELGAGMGAREGEAERFERGRLAAEDKRQSGLDELNRALVDSQIGRNQASGRASDASARRKPKGFAPRNPNELSTFISTEVDRIYQGIIQNPDSETAAEAAGLTLPEFTSRTTFSGLESNPILGQFVKSGRINQGTIRAAAERFQRANKPSSFLEQLRFFNEMQQGLQSGEGMFPGETGEPDTEPDPGDQGLLSEEGVLGFDESTKRTIVTAAFKAELEASGQWNDDLFMVGTGGQ